MAMANICVVSMLVERFFFSHFNRSIQFVSFIFIPSIRFLIALVVVFVLRLLFFAHRLFFAVPPMVMIQNQLVGAPTGDNITLECSSEAFPKSINFWMRSGSKNDSIITTGKF